MLQMLIPAVTSLVGKFIDKNVQDKDEANKLKTDLASQINDLARQELEGAVKIVVAEAQGGSWLQRSWRPITMLTFLGLVVAHWLGFTAENITEPVVMELLRLVQIGLGGYVVGRSAEKGIKLWREKD